MHLAIHYTTVLKRCISPIHFTQSIGRMHLSIHYNCIEEMHLSIHYTTVLKICISPIHFTQSIGKMHLSIHYNCVKEMHLSIHYANNQYSVIQSRGSAESDLRNTSVYWRRERSRNVIKRVYDYHWKGWDNTTH